MKNIYFEKNSLFLGGDYSGGGKFFKLFSSHFERLLLQLQTLQVSEGVLGTNFFLMGPEVKNTGRQKLLQYKNA